MKYLPLIWKNIWRKKARAIFTLLSIVMAFALFGLLSAVRAAFSGGVELTGADRLVMVHKVSLIQPLPFSYMGRIRATPGVEAVAHATWFGGYYQKPENFFGQFPVDPENYLSMFPEILLPEDQKRAWLKDREGAVVGRRTAEQLGFKIGDRVPISGSPWRRKDGKEAWEFNVVGIYDGAEKGTDTTAFMFRYDYFDEARARGKGLVGWYTIRVDDPDRAAEIAQAIDANFQNSPAETKTSTEKAFAQGWANQIGNIGAIVEAISAAVFFIILLVAANTMAQSVRERVNEIAVLKTLGFGPFKVLGLVLGEAFFLALVGGVLGLMLAQVLVGGVGKVLERFLPIFYLPSEAVTTGLVIAALVGAIAGIVPGIQSMRLPIAAALRRG
ncbi:MAG TPA: ABC transporter permease [Thermoanaerobaculia bacterium]|nr:ABC transporter permease [Thermoanaerobaculia bacterium]